MTPEKRAKLEALNSPQIADNIRRYREKGLTTGGPYSLAELLMEQKRRTPSPFPHVEVARKIVEISRKAQDGRATYKEIWDAFCPGQPWQGNGSVTKVGNALGRVIEYCVRTGLPVLSVLVVQSGSRALSPKAITNIYNECHELGVEVGLDPEAFVGRQTQLALGLTSTELPDDVDA